jgi:NitT/TauT family transport system ATP-binding protein
MAPARQALLRQRADDRAYTRPAKGVLTIADAIAFRNVGLTLGGNRVLEGIDFTVKPGEFVCVIGPSGCGKTTLLRLVAGLLQPTSGGVLSHGEPVTRPPEEVAVVFQDYGRALLPWRTAAGNVSFALEAIGMPAVERPAVIDEILGKLGLAQHAHKYPRQLSGGMQQRLQIARCLAQRPMTLLMDEPFGALDAMTRHALQDEVLRMAAQLEMTMLFVTHDLEEALYIGTRVIALRGTPGRIVAALDVSLPFPRNQVKTREHPEFLRLRRELFAIIEGGGH